jgi:hypothetical protein
MRSALDQPICVGVGRVRELLGQQARQLGYTLVSVKDAAAFQDDAGWRDVALDVLVEAVFSRQPEVIGKDLLGRARTQVLSHRSLRG